MKNITTEIEYTDNTMFNMETERFERAWWILVLSDGEVIQCYPVFAKPTKKQVRKFKNHVIKRHKQWDALLNNMNKELCS